MAVFAGTLSGTFLPSQITYKGKTSACLPSVKFPKDWHITCYHNHWVNESRVKDYIVVPYITEKKELKLSPDRRTLCIIDNFSAHCTDDVMQSLEVNKIDTVYVPPNCIGELQPMDLNTNKSVKAIIRKEFHQRNYSTE